LNNHLKFSAMKKQDYVIIIVGILFFACMLYMCAYIALNYNNGNAGLHGGY
jgi:hypothetical protein